MTTRLDLLGIALPLIVSVVCGFIDLSILFLPWVAFLLGVVSGTLLRSWRALLLVPVAVIVGTLPSIISIANGLPDVTSPGFIAGLILFVTSALIPSMIGSALGVPLGHELER